MTSFRTSDLYEAAFLYAHDQKLVGLEGERQKWFVFEGQMECESLSSDYWSKRAVINAKDFADSIRTLKDRLFARGG